MTQSMVGTVERHRAVDIEAIFHDVFYHSHDTQLVGGREEPLYVPAASVTDKHTIYYRHDYFASALHEVAHWCIAGAKRRTLRDFGYWYHPDGRNAEQQKHFESVEIKPQAVECLFSQAAEYPFLVSLDNLDNASIDTNRFSAAIQQQVEEFSNTGLPKRAAQFFRALSRFYCTDMTCVAQRDGAGNA